MIAANGDNHRIPGNRRSRDLTADGLRHNDFSGVDNVIAGDGVNGQRRAAKINGHIVSRAVAVARAIAQAGGDGLATGRQRRDIRRRNAHAPVTGGIQRGGVVLPFSVTVTTSPAAAPVLVPLTTNA